MRIGRKTMLFKTWVLWHCKASSVNIFMNAVFNVNRTEAHETLLRVVKAAKSHTRAPYD